MPFKSQSQRALFYAKMRRGEISPETVKEWESETPKGKKLPKKLKKKAFVTGFEKVAVVDMSDEATLMGVFTGPSGYKAGPGQRGQVRAETRETGQADRGHNRAGNPNAFGEDRDFDPTQKLKWKNQRVPG